MPADSAVEIRKYASVRLPTRPTLRMSPIPATPSVIDVNTSGITVMRSIRRNTWPTGPATLSLIQRTTGAAAAGSTCIQRIHHAPPASALANTPHAAPATSPTTILVWSFTAGRGRAAARGCGRSEEHTSELQSRLHLVCRLLLEKKKKKKQQEATKA